MSYQSTKLIELGSCAFRQFGANHSHCQYLHGYQLKAKFIFGCTTLDDRNWSVDFGGLKELKAILQHQFDHTLCVADNDPQLELFKQLQNVGACQLRIMPGGVGMEKTAEWCFHTAEDFITLATNNRCWVESVEVFEHEANSAIYIKNSKTTAWNLVDKKEEPVLLNETKTESAPAPQPTIQPQPEPQKGGPVHVGPRKVTSGYSGLFDNLSWGSR